MDLLSASRPALHTLEIEPPSARAETWHVLRMAALILLAAWLYIAGTAAPDARPAGWTAVAAGVGGAAANATAGAGGSAAGASTAGAAAASAGGSSRDLMPYQRLFRTLAGEEQRLFRELQE